MKTTCQLFIYNLEALVLAGHGSHAEKRLLRRRRSGSDQRTDIYYQFEKKYTLRTARVIQPRNGPRIIQCWVKPFQSGSNHTLGVTLLLVAPLTNRKYLEHKSSRITAPIDDDVLVFKVDPFLRHSKGYLEGNQNKC